MKISPMNHTQDDEAFQKLSDAGFNSDEVFIHNRHISPRFTYEQLIDSGFLEAGRKVKFLNKNGYDHDLNNARNVGMKEGDIFTIKTNTVGDWSSSYTFEEVSGHFNTVMFDAI